MKPVAVRTAIVGIAVAIAAAVVVLWPDPDRGGARIVYSTDERAAQPAADAIRERLAALGLDSVSVIVKGDQIIVEIGGGPQQIVRARSVLENDSRLEFRLVDSDSPFMKQVYRRVAEGDVDAAALGVTAEVDSWTTDAGSNHVDYYLRGDDRDALALFLERLEVAMPLFQLPADREVVYERVDGDETFWRSYLVQRDAVLGGESIASATRSSDPMTDLPIVLVDLDRHGGEVFGDLTSTNVGRKLATLVGGRVVSAPVINSAIRGGRLSISMGGDLGDRRREADALVAALRTGVLPSRLTIESVTVVGPIRPDNQRQRWGFALLVVALGGLYAGWDAWRKRDGRNPPEPRPATS